MPVEAARRVRRDVGVEEKRFLVLDAPETVLQVGFAGPDRLDLGPRQGDARLVRLLDVVFGQRAAVGRYHLHGMKKMRGAGVEPARVAPLAPEASASAIPPPAQKSMIAKR